MRTEGRAPTLDEAKAQFEAAWRQWLAGAKLREMVKGGAEVMMRRLAIAV
jgi:hypothetical protein